MAFLLLVNGEVKLDQLKFTTFVFVTTTKCCVKNMGNKYVIGRLVVPSIQEGLTSFKMR